jgi:hypothetical protein
MSVERLNVARREENAIILCWMKMDDVRGYNVYTSPDNIVFTKFNTQEISNTPVTNQAYTRNDLLAFRNGNVVFKLDHTSLFLPRDIFYIKVTTIDLSGLEENIALVQSTEIYPKGILPNKSNDEIMNNSHLWGWDSIAQLWRKIACVYDPITGLYKLSTDANISVTVDPSSISIADVVIKDQNSNVKMDVKNDGIDNAAVVTANFLPLPTGAATQATLAAVLAKLGDVYLTPAQLTALQSVSLSAPIPTGSNVIGKVQIDGTPLVYERKAHTACENKKYTIGNTQQAITFSQDIYEIHIYNNGPDYDAVYVNLNGGTVNVTDFIPIKRGEIYTVEMKIVKATGIKMISEGSSDVRLAGLY